MSTGATLWRVQVGPAAGVDAWSVSAHDGLVLVAARDESWRTEGLLDYGGNNVIVALDGVSGEVAWRWQVPKSRMVYNFLGAIVEEPASVVFSTSEGQPYRVRLCDGTTLWEGSLPSLGAGELPTFSSGGLAVAANGRAYVTSNAQGASTLKVGHLSAYDIETGDLLWSRRQASEANNAPAIGALGSTGRLSVVIGLGPNPGLPASAGGAPVPLESQVVAVDAESGEPTGWYYAPPTRHVAGAEGDAMPDRICLPDVWSNGAIDGRGTMYIGHVSGNVFAIRDNNADGVIDEALGEVVQYYGGRCYQGSPGLAPGMVATTPCDGLHVFQPTNL
jgi:outer membrane protein assembly factor BamB